MKIGRPLGKEFCRFVLSALAGTFIILGGCGYHTTTHSDRLPTDVHTIAIPAFVNQSQSYRVEQILTAAVVREFNTRTRYRVLSQTSDAADATLRGTVIQTQAAPLTYDSQTGRASSAIVTVALRVSLVDRKGSVLYDNPNYVFREQYQVSRELSSFFDEETPAMDRLARDFARTLISNVLEAF
ncbi:MAG TPA: LptE family protein [Terriglobales bacterium]|nr:LptE family protein [Terriglobales bacterium]